MPATNAATRDYQTAQVALRALTYKDIAQLWRLLDTERLDATFTVFAAAVLNLIRQRRAVSVVLASQYLAAMRSGLADAAPAVTPPELRVDQVLADLRYAAVISIKVAMAQQRPLDLASRNALVLSMGVADKHINDGGRNYIRTSIEADPAAKGWVRVTLGTCGFCKDQAAGDNMQAGSADFPRHDHCGCVPQPVYEGGLAARPEVVQRVKDDIASGKFTERDYKAVLDPAVERSAQFKHDIRTALRELEDARSKVENLRVILPEPPEDALLTREQYQVLTPERAWSAEKRDEILTTLRETPEGKVLADTLEKFQDGGSIARLRTKIDQFLEGAELDATSKARVEAVLDAIRNAPENWAPETLYRGMTVKGKLDNVLAKYVEGDTLDLSLTSFTSDRKVATKFQKMTSKGGNETRIMVELVGEGKKAIPIQNLPKDHRLFREKEWVSAGRYEIVSAKKSTGAILLRIRQAAAL